VEPEGGETGKRRVRGEADAAGGAAKKKPRSVCPQQRKDVDQKTQRQALSGLFRQSVRSLLIWRRPYQKIFDRHLCFDLCVLKAL
jgi:hypothetical protein